VRPVVTAVCPDGDCASEQLKRLISGWQIRSRAACTQRGPEVGRAPGGGSTTSRCMPPTTAIVAATPLGALAASGPADGRACIAPGTTIRPARPAGAQSSAAPAEVDTLASAAQPCSARPARG
jgi:hypothetical protein